MCVYLFARLQSFYNKKCNFNRPLLLIADLRFIIGPLYNFLLLCDTTAFSYMALKEATTKIGDLEEN